MVLLLGVAFALPSLGYFFMVADIRAYLRSLRRAMVRVITANPFTPAWAVRQTPRCFAAFGLRLPCSEEELKRAYREKVKLLHPDRGGDRRRFLLLQAYFEESLELLRRHGPQSPLSDPRRGPGDKATHWHGPQ